MRSVLYKQVIASLRAEVKNLEDGELVEQMFLRGSNIGLEEQPSTSDIDALMLSMMGLRSDTRGRT